MKSVKQTLIAALAVIGLFGAARASAQNVYTFDGPGFTVGETTPMANRAPDSGNPLFLASFSSSNTPLVVYPDVGSFTSPFVNNNLIDGYGVSNLRIDFNMSVTDLSVDFAFNEAATGPAGMFMATLSTGEAFNLSGTNTGGYFQQGTLSFHAASPFTWVRLEATNAGGSGTSIAIDNLSLTASPSSVPEPASLGLLLFGGLGVAATAVRKRKRE